MFENLIAELGEKGAGALGGVLAGSAGTWIYGWWRSRQERQRVYDGDASNTVVIQLHLVESQTAEVRGERRRVASSLRIRTLGHSQVSDVVPNEHLANELRRRARGVVPSAPLISMSGVEGSYLLETFTNFVCDRVANGPFEHDSYVLSSACEASDLTYYQPVTLMLIPLDDLVLFEDWEDCQQVRVEHGGDGMRVLTLWKLANACRDEHRRLTELRAHGESTRFRETMYVLDLAIDTRSALIPVKPVPWPRYHDILKGMNLPLPQDAPKHVPVSRAVK